MRIHVGTTTGLYLVGDATEELLGGTRINHVNEANGVLWVADGKGRIHRDGELVAKLPSGSSPLCIQPARTATWIGASAAQLYRLDGEGLSEDEFFADAPGRDSWHTPWGGPPDVRSMTLSSDRTLYINVHVGGILRYDNTGLVPTIDIGSDVHQVASHPSREGQIFAACAYGLATSHDGHDFEIRSHGLHARYCRAVAVAEDVVYVSASTGPTTSRGRVYRTDIKDGALAPLTTGLPDWFDDNVNTHCVLVKDDLVCIGFGDTVWVSEDGGDSFTKLVTGLSKITCLA